MQHTYVYNRYTDEQVKAMQSADGPSQTFQEVLDQDEIKFLQTEIKKVDYPEVGKTSKYSGASYDDPQVKIIKEIFDAKLKNIIGDYQLDFYAWQEAIKPWKAHADLRWYKDKIPYKVILFPINVISDQDSWKDTYTIAFKQRNYLEDNANKGEAEKGNSDQSTWKRPCERPGTHNLVNGYKISKEQHGKYFSHMPYEFMEGLEIDNIYKWSPGSCVTWDQNALHCADNFVKNNIKTKLSIIFFTNQKNG